MNQYTSRPGTGGTTLLIAVYGVTALASNGLFPVLYASDVVGWRYDGRGEFNVPSAPTRWSREEGIVWKTPLPATSLSSPVVAGEYAFVMAEPHRLLCLRVSDGEVLWENLHEYESIFGPEKTNEIKQQHAESLKVRQEIAALEKQLKSAQDADPRSKDVSSLQDQIRQLRQRDEELTVIPPPQADATGNTASTPVCDRDNVYVVLGNGIVSSHRVDGRQNWIRYIGKPMSRHSASPLIVGNLLIVHLQQLTALDPQSGEVVWTADTPPRNGTPIALMVGDQAVLVTPAGAIVRVADGEVLARNLFDLAYCSPIAQDGVVFAAERERLLAIQVSAGDDNTTVQTDVRWQTRSSQGDRLASPVVQAGLLFSATGSGILEIVDIKTGKIIQRKRLGLEDGRIDASLSLSNDLLYIQSTNGTTVVFEPTSDCPEIARNETDGSSSSPFLVDERILLRTASHLICIGGISEPAESGSSEE